MMLDLARVAPRAARRRDGSTGARGSRRRRRHGTLGRARRRRTRSRTAAASATGARRPVREPHEARRGRPRAPPLPSPRAPPRCGRRRRTARGRRRSTPAAGIVLGVDAPAREHPRAAGERELRVAPQHERLDPSGRVAEEHDGARRGSPRGHARRSAMARSRPFRPLPILASCAWSAWLPARGRFSAPSRPPPELPMKPAPFEYHAPESVGRRHRRCSPSTATTPRCSPVGRAWCRCWRMRLTRFEHIVDLNRVDELRGIERTNGTLTIEGDDPSGAWSSTTTAAGEAVPLLAEAHPAHRPLPDPQPRHRRRFDRPRRPRLGAARGRARARRRARGRRHRRHRAGSRPPSSSSAPGPPRSSDDEMLTAVHFPVWAGRCRLRGRRDRPPQRRLRARRCRLPRSSSNDAGAVSRSAIGLFGMGSTPVRARRRRGRAQRHRSPTPPTSPRSARLAAAGLHSDATTCTRRPSTGQHVGAHLVQRALDRALGDSAEWLSTRSQLTVNGERRTRARRGAQDARRLPARGLRAHRHAPRVRARRVRRVHGAGRRRRGAFVPDVRGAGRGRRRRDDRGHRPGRRLARPGAGGVPPGPRAAVRVLHARLRRERARVPRSRTRTPRSTRSAKGSRATSAAAPATRGSSRRCRSRRSR